MTDGGEIFGGSSRRRRWTEEDKARIVAECEAPGSSVSIVARRHDLNTNMVFTWRREFQRRQSGAAADPVSFVPAVIAPDDLAPEQRLSPHTPQPRPEVGTAQPTAGRIEIVLSNSRRIIVDQDVSAAALARVIGVLERR
jgi:transposase